MAITLNNITNTVQDVERMTRLSKTSGGRKLLKNITRSLLLQSVDKTSYKSPPHRIEKFKQAFSDLQRPNRFEVLFNTEKDLDLFGEEGVSFNITSKSFLTPLIKSMSIPSIVTNSMSFKRCGKTINIPLNQDVADQLDLILYQDIDNNTYSNIMTLMNTKGSDYHARFSEENSNVTLSFIYLVNINTNSVDDYPVIDQALDFLGIDFFDKYYNSADKKYLKKSLSKNVETKILELKFNNVYISSLKTSDGDMERIDNYSDITMSLKYSGMDLFSWNWKEIGEDGEATYQNSKLKDGYKV
jgi:hypothetical protein